MNPQHKPRILTLGVDDVDFDNASCQPVQSQQEVVKLMASGAFDAVLTSCRCFDALERNLAEQQASVILNTIGEGVLVADRQGQICWSNARMKGFAPQAMKQVLEICSRAVEMFTLSKAESGTAELPSARKFSFPVEHDQFFELIVSPITPFADSPSTPSGENTPGRVEQVVAIVWDMTRSKRMELKVNAINTAGRELAKLESSRIAKLSPTERLDLLRDKITKTSKDLLDFDHFGIRVVDERDKKLEIVIDEGLPPDALEVDLYAQPEGNGISGYVAATGRSYICDDTEKDPRYILGIDHCKSSLTVPLRLHDKIIGVFNIESESVGAFHEDDRLFAEIFGQYIAIALNTLNLLVVERCNTSGQIAASVVAEMTHPLNDIVARAKALMGQYIGDEHMHEQLDQIIQKVESVRVAVRDVARGTRTVLGTGDVKTNMGDPLLSGKRILIADDEVNIRTAIGDILTKHGCLTKVAKDGFDAIQQLDNHTFDLVLSDIRMPHRNGYEIYAAVQRKDKNVPVILMTGFGYDPHHSIVRANQDGLCAVLFKPFKVDQMLEAVRKALSGHSVDTPNQAKS